MVIRVLSALMLLAVFGSAWAQGGRDDLIKLQQALNASPDAAQKARAELENLSSTGNATATFILGQMYVTGAAGISADTEKGMVLVRKAADMGDPDAMLTLAVLHENGRLGVRRDLDLANQWLIRAADAGNLEAQTMAASGYLFGERGLPVDIAKANRYLEMAAPDDPISAHILGVHYSTGKGVPKDEQKAIQLWRQAARAGNPISQQFLRNRNLSW